MDSPEVCPTCQGSWRWRSGTIDETHRAECVNGHRWSHHPPPVTALSYTYDRAVLVDVLVHHYRKDSETCGCGWAKLGASHPEHVADMYENAVRTGT